MEQTIGDLVIYKNNQLIAFNKPCGVAVQNDPSGDKSLLSLAEIFCKSNVHIIHRLDRPASGTVLFAKTPKAQANLNAQFQQRSIRKAYLAVVGNRPSETTAKLTHYLRKQRSGNKSRICKATQSGAKLAELEYELLGSSERYHLLQIRLITGRHHQVRAQLAAIGCPIKGDVKYGFRRSNRDRSIHLHAWQLGFQHPVTKTPEILEAQLPSDPVWDAFRPLLDAKKSGPLH